MDENNRELYAPPTLAKFLGEAPEGPNCKKYGPIIADFIKREIHKSFKEWLENYDNYIAIIYCLPIPERLQKLHEYLCDFKEYAYDIFVNAYVGHYKSKIHYNVQSNIEYSFIDEHWNGDMDFEIVGIVRIAAANYMKIKWPFDLPQAVRIKALEILMNYTEDIHEQIITESSEVKRLIKYGH